VVVSQQVTVWLQHLASYKHLHLKREKNNNNNLGGRGFTYLPLHVRRDIPDLQLAAPGKKKRGTL